VLPDYPNLLPVSLRVLHASLATVTAAAAFALLLAAGFALVRGTAYSIRLVLLVRRVAVVAAIVAGIAGVVLLLTGVRPHEELHLLYGLFALVTVPAAAQLAVRTPQRGALYHLLAAVLLLGVCVRLASTG
jgi:hypothetical protein